jgi:thiamine-monophosphate kinase
MALTEFELIARYFSDLGCQPSHSSLTVDLGVGDDCALLSLSSNQQLALSLDTLVEGIHFPENAAPYLIAQRALSAAVSDLAAMGATPAVFTLALTLPRIDENWLEQFSQGLAECAAQYQIRLIGGDTTRGALSISIQVHGTLATGRMLKRSGAEVGDLVFVSGTLGDAAAALAVIEGRLKVDDQQSKYFMQRFYQPTARIMLGQSLVGVASAAIDVSDGLLADLAHITSASQLGAEVYASQLPVSPELQAVTDGESANRYALIGGDDYELCFTVAPQHREQIKEFAELFDLPLTEVGRITAGQGVSCLAANGETINFSQKGYQHFNQSDGQ